MNRESRMEAVARDVFSQVRTSIVMKMRFLDMAVFKLKPVASDIPLATDGVSLYYHPAWLLKDMEKCISSPSLRCMMQHS